MAALPVLSVRNVSKKYCRDLKRSLWYGVRDISAELAGRKTISDRLRPQEFWALRDASFDLMPGENIGLVGPNGAGKSTLLKLINGLIKPNAGQIVVRGRVGALINLGAGFNPLLSGRENIFINAAVLGISKAETSKVLDDIIEFSELAEFIETPVSSYSAGMRVRLGFAVAVQLKPDILLIDEVLAVGDLGFRMKCYKKLSEINESGTAFVFVSHNPALMASICSQALYLDRGRMVAMGAIEEILTHYEKDVRPRIEPSRSPQGPTARGGAYLDDSALKIDTVFFTDSDGNATNAPKTGSAADLCIRFVAHRKVEAFDVNIAVDDLNGGKARILSFSTKLAKTAFAAGPGRWEVRLRFPFLSLMPGNYGAKIFFLASSLHVLDAVESYPFMVRQASAPVLNSLFNQAFAWDMVPADHE